MQLHLEEWGDDSSPTLVCLHGVTAHGRRFRPVAERLADRFHVVAPDLRGHGRSGWEPPWSLEQHLEDILESVPADAGLWVGHSFGGRLVLELAFAHPERIDRGVLLDPAIWVPGRYALPHADEVRADRSWATVDEAVDDRISTDTTRRAPRELLVRDFADHLEPDGDGRLRLRFSRSAAVAVYGELARTPPQDALSVPLLVVRALEAQVCPEALVDAYRSTAGDLLEATAVPGGHVVMWDALDETVAAIEDFLGR